MFQSKKTITFLIIIIFFGYFGYRVFLKNNSSVDNFLPQSQSGQDIVNLTQKLQNSSIDQSIFTSALFMSMKDFTVSILPEEKGRPNPFAPIGSDSTSFVSQTKVATSTQTRSTR